jgi:hypothetical protein
MADTAPRPAGEFDCCECGRHIIQIAGPVSEFGLCAACTFMPGWLDDPKLVAVLDPDRARDPNA